MTARVFDPDNIGFLINDVARLLRRNFNRRVQSLGLTQAQWRAIVHLSRAEGMTQVTLAENLEIQPITVTRLLDRMQAAGWVERRSHPEDRRAVQLFLTAKSTPILEEMHSRAAETLADSLNGVAAKQVIAGLQRMKQNLSAAEAAADSHPTEKASRDVGRRPARTQRAR